MIVDGSRPAFFLQPHSDDVALSCGGTVAAWVRAGGPAHLLTVFSSRIVPQMVGDLARSKHARWNLHDVDALFETRRDEDAAAACILGCETRWLEMPDAIYRGDRYPDNADLFGSIHPEESAFAAHLVEELENLPEWSRDGVVFVPLGVGNHVDHQILFELGRLLAAEGHDVLAYEDTPYVIHTPAGLDARLAAIGMHLKARSAVDVSDTLASRLDAIARYESQVPVIFRFTDDWRRAVTEHTRARGGGVPAEWFWSVAGG